MQANTPRGKAYIGGDEDTAPAWQLLWAPAGPPRLAIISRGSSARRSLWPPTSIQTTLGCEVLYLKHEGWAHWAPDAHVRPSSLQLLLCLLPALLRKHSPD